MPSVYFDFDEELGRWKPNKRGREKINALRILPDGRPARRRGGNREWNDPNRPPRVSSYARGGGNLFNGGTNGREINRLGAGGGNRVQPARAAETRARRDLGQNAASRSGGGGGAAGRLRGVVNRARNAAADFLEGAANGRRRRRR